MQAGNPGHEFSIPGHLQTSIKISLNLYPCEKWLILVKNFRSSSPVKFLKSTRVLGRDVYYSLYFTLSRTFFSFSRNNADKKRTSKRPFAHHARMSTSISHVSFFIFTQRRNKKGPFTLSFKPTGERAPPLLRVMLLLRGLKSSVSSHNVPSVTGG